MSGQLLLFTPRQASDGEPDTQHQWARRSFMPERQDEWRCDPCGELATRSVIDGVTWEFYRPRLVAEGKGKGHFANASHLCEPRAWH